MMDLILSTLESGVAGVDAIGGEMGAGFMGQVMAVATWMGAGGTSQRLKDIAVPTLVMHGGDDLLLPLGNGEGPRAGHPRCALRIFPEAGHALNAEYPDEVNTELVAHFEQASARV